MKSFQFKSKGEIPEIVYQCYQINEDSEYTVSWYEDQEQRIKSTKYPVLIVENHLKKGDWILVNDKSEQVHSPKHYNVLEDIEAIQIIAGSMSQEMFKGYCLGNILKYRLRCGAKDDVNQELAKADKYKELFAKYKHLCKEDK